MDLMSLATSGGQAEGGRYERLRTLRARSSKVRPAKGGSPSTWLGLGLGLGLGLESGLGLGLGLGLGSGLEAAVEGLQLLCVRRKEHAARLLAHQQSRLALVVPLRTGEEGSLPAGLRRVQ